VRAAEGARHAAETPIGSDTEAERAARIEGSRSQGEDEKLTSLTEPADAWVNDENPVSWENEKRWYV